MITLNFLKFDIISGIFGYIIGFLSLWILFEWRRYKEKQDKLNSMISTIKYSQSLHWNPLEERRGIGDLIVKVNHIAITVSDVGRSISFYVDILGFQQVRRPPFDRHGAWLTMGNIELHLIKGIPTIPNIDDIHVSHIAFETLDINKLINKLRQLNIDVRQSLLIPNINKSKSINKRSIYQYFLNDPDGYYLEVCNCHIITEYALNKDKTIYNIDYHEGISNKKIFYVIKAFLHWKKKSEKYSDQQFSNLLKEIPRANQIDENKFKNLVKRRSIHGDLMELFTDEDIKQALLQTNNIVPLTIQILTRNIHQNKFFQSSSVVDNQQSIDTQPSIIDTNHSN